MPDSKTRGLPANPRPLPGESRSEFSEGLGVAGAGAIVAIALFAVAATLHAGDVRARNAERANGGEALTPIESLAPAIASPLRGLMRAAGSN